MIKFKGNIICSAECDGWISYDTLFWPDEKIKERFNVPRKAKITIASISVDYETFPIKYCECIISDGYKEHNLIQDILEARNVDIHKFKNDPPLYEEGSDWVYEICYSVWNASSCWLYCKETPIHKIIKIWDKTDLEKYANKGNYEGDWILDVNLDYLKENEFVSKLSNPYEVKIADVNYLQKKLNKNITIKL